MTTPTLSLGEFLQPYRLHIDNNLQAAVADAAEPESLRLAMQHALLLGGKRVRPCLTLLVGEVVGAPQPPVLQAALAVECVHAYSLVHDDLPAMDNDALRRGQPTVHIAFDEATAILAGDALQTLAFELLSKPVPKLAPAQQLHMVQLLARASGGRGMCGGQAIDLAATGQQQSEPELAHMHDLKTGALIQAAVLLGAYCGPTPPSAAEVAAWQGFSQALGLAFQVQDDILDVTSSTAVLGKPQGSDLAAGKSTYVQLLGLAGAQARVQHLHHKALQALAAIPYNTDSLAQLAELLLTRDY